MKILIVEDSRFAQTVMQRLFAESFPGSEIIVCSDGLDGLQAFSRANPDLVVTDLLMPCMNGQEFIKRIREKDQQITICTVTADIQQSSKAELAQYDIAAFINKPLNKEKMGLLQQIVEERLHAY